MLETPQMDVKESWDTIACSTFFVGSACFDLSSENGLGVFGMISAMLQHNDCQTDFQKAGFHPGDCFWVFCKTIQGLHLESPLL